MNAKANREFNKRMYQRVNRVEAAIDELLQWAYGEKTPQRVRPICTKILLLEKHLQAGRQRLGAAAATLVHADDLKNLPR